MPRKEGGEIRGDAGAGCLSSGSNWGEGVETVEPLLFGELLWPSDSLVVSVWKSVGDGLTGKVERDVWVARAGT